jgi:CRP-like cAMP-binding protein
MTQHDFAPGQSVFFAGDTGDRLYVVVAGTVLRGFADANGREVLLDVLAAGDLFGEIALLSAGPRTAGAAAKTQCLLLGLARAEFRRILKAHNEIALTILDLVSDHCRLTSEKFQDLALRPLEERLITTLLRLAERHGVPTTRGVEIAIRLSQTELANLTVASRQRVNRQLNIFERSGAILRHDRRIVLCNPAGLRRQAHGAAS